MNFVICIFSVKDLPLCNVTKCVFPFSGITFYILLMLFWCIHAFCDEWAFFLKAFSWIGLIDELGLGSSEIIVLKGQGKLETQIDKTRMYCLLLVPAVLPARLTAWQGSFTWQKGWHDEQQKNSLTSPKEMWTQAGDCDLWPSVKNWPKQEKTLKIRWVYIVCFVFLTCVVQSGWFFCMSFLFLLNW